MSTSVVRAMEGAVVLSLTVVVGCGRGFFAVMGERAGWLRRLSVILVSLTSFACGGPGRDPPKPVPACQEYERAAAKCSGRNVPIASQPAALASTEADRNRLTALCELNLQRLNAACR
jgi:hypothetical protein